MKLLTLNLIWKAVIISCLFFINISQAQQVNKIFEEIGGGSGTNNDRITESEDNTIYYVLGAAAIAGIVIYAVLQDKKSKDKSNTDTTDVTSNEEFIEKQLILSKKILSYKSDIPINVSLGVKNDLIRKEEKRYFVGISYNF